MTNEKGKHTPEPWVVHGKQHSGAYQIAGPGDGALRICTVTNADNDAENACLIAAAPAMLEALKQARERLIGIAESNPTRPCSALIHTIDAAIAAAEGEATK